MASPVYSTRFLQRQNLTGIALYTVPEGMVAIVRDADIFDGSSEGGDSYVLQITRADETNTTTIDQFESSLTDKIHQWRGRQVLNEGDVLSATVAVGMDVTVSGYLLTAP